MYIKRLLLLLLALLISVYAHALGNIETKKRSGAPRVIGLIITSLEDPFFVNTTVKIKEYTSNYNIRVVTSYVNDSKEEQLDELKRLYALYGIDGLIIEALDEEVVEDINAFAIKNQISVIYINESSELTNIEMPPHRRIAKYTHSDDFALYQMEYAQTYFVQNNIRAGTVLLLYDNSDPAQDKQANLIIRDYEDKRIFDTRNFDIQYRSLRNYQETVKIVEELLTETPNVTAIFTTNNKLADWASIGLRNYKASQSTDRGERARRSARKTRAENNNRRSAYTSFFTGASESALDNLIILSPRLQSDFFEKIDDGEINMSIYRNASAYADQSIQRLIRISEGKNIPKEEEYIPDIITTSNIFRYKTEFDDLREFERKNEIDIIITD